MSKAATSPTARLLQSSRLFSLPRPLPAPLNDTLTSTGQYRGSDTATLPYPTHQAITTPSSALHRGDFGLKRSLPNKTTRQTSTPHVRVHAQDTYEHITDFSSAADHTLTQRKWAEMGVPMVMKKPGSTSSGTLEGPSVYESWLDNTDPDARAAPVPRNADTQTPPMQRWKYAGPWLQDMQEGEFNSWLERKIESRRGEWKEFIRKWELDRRMSGVQRQAREQGQPLSPGDIARLRQENRPTDLELNEVEKGMRDGYRTSKLHSDLTFLLAEFLDLPGVVHSENASAMSRNAQTPGFQNLAENTQRASTQAPPTTHLGAGLSYIRSNAYMSNHPLWGPQVASTPVSARVIRPRKGQGQGGSAYKAKIGVGGFVTDDSASDTSPQTGLREISDPAGQMDENAEGGGKIWVHARKAYVDHRGRVNLDVIRADPEALAVRTGGKELEAILEAKRASAAARQAPRRGPQVGARGFGLDEEDRYGSSAHRFV